MRKVTKNLRMVEVGLVTTYGVMRIVANRKTEPTNIDVDNPYIKSSAAISNCQNRKTVLYEGKIKPVLNQILSFCGLIVLSLLFGVIALAIKINDPGPVFFIQKRIGKDKTYFMCHKFRSMRMNTPPNVPTHQLANPEQYLTGVGKILRCTSMDGNIVIGTITETVENKGFREVSPIFFFRGRDLISYNDINLNDHCGVRFLA